MKKSRSWILVSVAVVLLGVVPGGVAYVHATQLRYANGAPCTKLHGFAGMLQAGGLIDSGNCKLVKKGGCASEGNACTITNPPSGTSGKGTCHSLNSNTACECVPNK